MQSVVYCEVFFFCSHHKIVINDGSICHKINQNIKSRQHNHTKHHLVKTNNIMNKLWMNEWMNHVFITI